MLLRVSIDSAIEREFILALAASAQEMLVTCPAGDDRTLENLKGIPGIQEQTASSSPANSSLNQLRSYLFLEAAFSTQKAE